MWIKNWKTKCLERKKEETEAEKQVAPPVVTSPLVPAPPPQPSLTELEDRLKELKKERENKGIEQQKQAFREANLTVQARIIAMKEEFETQHTISRIKDAGYVMTTSEEDNLEREIHKIRCGAHWQQFSRGTVRFSDGGEDQQLMIPFDPCPKLSLDDLEKIHAEESADRILVKGDK